MSLHQKVSVSLGVLLVAVGICLMGTVMGTVGLAVGGLGLAILVVIFCKVMKSNNETTETIPGHFLLHPRTGTRYTYEQAIALQRRLDRIRRVSAEERRSIQRSPTTLTSLHNLPGTPPPWDMEPPPPYETVVKTTASPNQL